LFYFFSPVGHGPFSHSFEKWIHAYRPDCNFHHEEMSQRMFRHLVDDNALDYAEQDICFLEELVSGKYSQYDAVDSIEFAMFLLVC
jgi:HD superfamily phosphohydrolase